MLRPKGRSGICRAFNGCLFPHPLEFDQQQLQRVGIFVLITILYPEEDHMLTTGRNDFSSLSPQIYVPKNGEFDHI